MSKREVTPQRRAFLDAIAFGEGTDDGVHKTNNHGYDVIVGHTLFTDYSDHPRKLVKLNPKLSSTAAGRYQLLERFFDAYKKSMSLPDFSPSSQDQIALQQIAERKALEDVDAGRINDAVKKCRTIWASMPGSPYGQRTETLEKFLERFRASGGKVAGE